MERIDEVEVKLAFLERHILELDGVVRGLSDQVHRLKAELAELQDAGSETSGHEKPPHY